MRCLPWIFRCCLALGLGLIANGPIHRLLRTGLVRPVKAITQERRGRYGTPSKEAVRPVRVVHQIWIPFGKPDDTLPERWQAGPVAWRAALPGWEYRLWTSEEAQGFLAEHYEWFLPVWKSYPYGVQRVDSLRYFILYHFGGVYADLDVAPSPAGVNFLGLESLLLASPVTLVITPDLGLTNALMAAARPHEPFFLHLMSRLRAQGLARTWVSWLGRHWHIMATTSPALPVAGVPQLQGT